MKNLLALIGIIASYYILKKREAIGDMLGEAEWMRAIGGIYLITVVIGVFLFFWSVAELTNTTHILFAPIKTIFGALFPGGGQR